MKRNEMVRNVIQITIITMAVVHGAVVFGPVSYYRTTGAPDIYDTTFVAYDTTVACTLIVTNSDTDPTAGADGETIEGNITAVALCKPPGGVDMPINASNFELSEEGRALTISIPKSLRANSLKIGLAQIAFPAYTINFYKLKLKISARAEKRV